MGLVTLLDLVIQLQFTALDMEKIVILAKSSGVQKIMVNNRLLSEWGWAKLSKVGMKEF
jgi:hypothetical protein